ncbi:MAG: CynX/NimT family MFS transporter [Marmoricola sp.]
MTPSEPTPADRGGRAAQALVVVGIVALAFNLRPAAVSIGPVLDEVSHSLGMGTAATSLLTSLPVLSFATMGAVAPRFARLLGLHRTTLVALVLVALGLFARAHVGHQLAFLVLSFVALAGMAVANVLLPSLVKLHFPTRVGLLTALYSTSLAIGLTTASVATVPLGTRNGDLDWRRGLVVWGFTAAVAVLPWIALVRRDRRPQDSGSPIGTGDVARTRLGWVMAVFFGLQSLQAYSIFGWVAKVYRDADFSAHDAGLLLGAITGISIPLSFVIPALTARVKDQRLLLTAVMACYPVGYLGLILAPHSGAWVWAFTLGIGTCTFPFILTLIGLRARTAAGTAALSAFTQSAGYLIAVVGPFGVGALHAATDGWTVPLAVLLALCVPQYLVGLMACRPDLLEDQLDSAGARPQQQ